MHKKCVSWDKIHAFKMIDYTSQGELKNRIFKTPFDNKLDPSNRWMILEKLIPWDEMATVFFTRLNRFEGRGSIDLRLVLGAMFIQHTQNLTDRETIQTIQENIYMQYFVGLPSFQIKPVFDHSLLSVLRKRLGRKGSALLNEIFIKHAIDSNQVKHRKAHNSSTKDQDGMDDDSIDKKKPEDDQQDCSSEEKQREPNRGTVKIDASVVPQNITFPTDTKLLNNARELSEQIIDHLYAHDPRLWPTKPRTYRREARKQWLGFSKTRNASKKKIRKQRKADLNYLKRNLRYIDEMMALLISHGLQISLPENLRKKMYVIGEVYRQQKIMHDDNRKRISDRIVNISQPWVRPIVRGKAGSKAEFGSKINISVTEKMVTVDQISFNAYNESVYLKDQIESYRARFGYYPEFALVDKIYLTRVNRRYLEKHGIQHTGSPLGRPPKERKKKSKKLRKKNNERNHVEAKIGQGKQKFGLDKLRTKTKSTSYCAIHLIALVMNMQALVKRAYLPILDILESIFNHAERTFRNLRANTSHV